MGAQWYDANISLPGCDKNMPGTIIAMARLNRPSLMIYGGAPGGAGLTHTAAVGMHVIVYSHVLPSPGSSRPS